MKRIFILVSILLISSCAHVTNEYGCVVDQEKWIAIDPNEKKIKDYVAVIEKYDNYYERSLPTFWYSDNEKNIFACSYTVPIRLKRKMSPGCFVSTYLLELDQSGKYKVVDGEEIVCT